MTQFSSHAPGQFCWVDLSAKDMKAAGQWYAELMGWRIADSPSEGPPYAMCFLGEHVVAGLGQLSKEMIDAGVPPCWNSYV